MSACSKIILLGEHSVVYGKKALAIPVKELTVQISLVDYEVFEEEHTKYIKKIIENNFNVPKKYIKIDSSIPICSGMGSSAALAISIAREYKVDEKFVVNLAEIKMHGKPSGIDANVILNEKALIFQKGKENEFLENLGAYLVISETKELGNTKEAIERVKKLNRLDLIEELGKITIEGIKNYKIKDLKALGKNFKLAQDKLRELTLSTEKIEYIINKARPFCLGSKLSGGGLGGVVISLCDKLESAIKLKEELDKNNIKDIYIVKI